MTAVARAEKAESETDTIQTAPHDQEADAMHNHREATTKRQGVTTTETTTRLKMTAETTEVNELDNMIVTAGERPGHRVLIDDVSGLCDCSNTSPLEAAVRPKRDMDAEKPIGTEIMKDTVRHKCDMDAEKSAETVNENDAVRPKCDDEAAGVDDDATNKQEKIANDKAAAK